MTPELKGHKDIGGWGCGKNLRREGYRREHGRAGKIYNRRTTHTGMKLQE